MVGIEKQQLSLEELRTANLKISVDSSVKVSWSWITIYIICYYSFKNFAILFLYMCILYCDM